jgi:hypothetical protein
MSPVPTLHKAERVTLCLEAEGRHFKHLLEFVNTIGAPHDSFTTDRSHLYENQDFNVLKFTNLTFKTDI